MRLTLLCIVVGLAVMAAAFDARPAAAQAPGTLSIGAEAGLPLVLGIDGSYAVSPRWRASLGFGRLSGLTAIRAEGRWLLRQEARGRLVPSLSAGAVQYFLRNGGSEATPVGIHAGIGLDYFLESPVSIGARIGGMKTFASSDGGGVKVFSVRNGFTTGTFNVGVRYYF